MANVPTIIGWAIGASIPGCLIYAVVQLVRKKATTSKGFYWIVGISSAAVVPRMIERESPNALASQTALFEGLKSGCEKAGVGPEKCTRLTSCTMTRLEALYPTDTTWLGFQRRAVAGEAKAKEDLDDAAAVCGSKQ